MHQVTESNDRWWDIREAADYLRVSDHRLEHGSPVGMHLDSQQAKVGHVDGGRGIRQVIRYSAGAVCCEPAIQVRAPKTQRLAASPRKGNTPLPNLFPQERYLLRSYLAGYTLLSFGSARDRAHFVLRPQMRHELIHRVLQSGGCFDNDAKWMEMEVLE
jgi:hypothetical protein